MIAGLKFFFAIKAKKIKHSKMNFFMHVVAQFLLKLGVSSYTGLKNSSHDRFKYTQVLMAFYGEVVIIYLIKICIWKKLK